MEIIRADHSGFCFGVKQAIDKAEKEASLSDKTIYSFGPLIHNKLVTGDLEKRGVKIVESLDALGSDDKVIIRSHGVGEEVYAKAERKGIKIVDGTCPYVARIHKLVKEAYEKGMSILIVGDENHPEVKGINGWCNNEAIILKEKKK